MLGTFVVTHENSNWIFWVGCFDCAASRFASRGSAQHDSFQLGSLWMECGAVGDNRFLTASLFGMTKSGQQVPHRFAVGNDKI
jgi:hypothetical protein